MIRSTLAGVLVVLSVATWCPDALAVRPLPIGDSMVTLSYETAGGTASFLGNRNFLNNALGFDDASALGAATNVHMFNSINSFGRRTFLANSNPAFAHVLGPDESLIAHAFFKNIPAQLDDDFFPGILEGSDITIAVNNIHFAHPVSVVESTQLFHTLLDSDQADEYGLHGGHHLGHAHNLHTKTNPFRDFTDFFNGVFSDFPEPNYVLADVNPVVSGSGTDSLNFAVTLPYDLLRNLSDTGHGAPPPGFPAPHGFLEPFHFHFEYVVTPEPTAIVLLAAGACFVGKRSRRPRH